MIVHRLLPLTLVAVAVLVFACGGDAEPAADQSPAPPDQLEAKDVSETPMSDVETATPDRRQSESVAETPIPSRRQTGTPVVAASTPARTEPSSCQLVQGEPGQPGEAPLRVEVVTDGLEIPWGLAILPNGDLLVTERPGRVRLIQGGEVVPEPVLEFGVSMPPPLYGIPLLGSEGGLLGLLLHPEFAVNRLFYLFYNIDNEDNLQIGRIERYALSGDGRSASFDRVILDDLPAGLHHQGGRMRVGPDGMLYVGVGAYEPHDAQDPDTLAGKLLRMDLEGGIPTDNPDPDSYVYASGIRNTQGYDWFDDQHIVMVEHGPSGIELGRQDLRGFDEVNVVTAGDNLGWPEIWGCDTQEGLVSPALTWEEPVPPTGAIFYRGDLIPEWTGSFLITTVGLSDGPGGRHLHRVVFDEDDPYTILSHEVYLHNVYGRLRTVVSDADGWLYVMTSNCDNRGECPPEGDKILRIGPERAESRGLPPDTLRPVAVDDPQAFLSGLSPREQSCLGDKGIGPQQLLQMMGRSPGGSPESTADIVNCLQDDTALRLFLTTLVGQVEPFSRETSLCIREGFVPIDLRGLLAPAVAGGAPANSLALSMVALNVSLACMNDDEWATYAPRLGMDPKDREGAACLFEELGGPAKLVEAMQEASLGDPPEEFTKAWEACGLEESAPPSR